MVGGSSPLRYVPQPGALPPSLLQGLSGPWEIWRTANFTPFCLCSSSLPPIGYSLAPRPFPAVPSPLPPRGP